MSLLERYLSSRERSFLDARRDILARMDPALVADNPFLFGTRFTMSHALVRIALFQKILHVSGSIVECGVAHGNGLMLFNLLSSVLEPYAINRHIVGFDTFDGFRDLDQSDPFDIPEDAFRGVSLEALRETLKLHDSDRATGHMEKVDLVVGDATDMIPTYVARHPELSIALLYLDFDVYKPTKTALEHLLPLVCKGGVVAFDEFNYRGFPGETKALKDTIDLRSVELRRFPFAPFVAYFHVS